MTESRADIVRDVLRAHGKLNADPAGLDEKADLFAAGMNSHASVNVMLGLEDRFGVEFPDRMLTREVFSSIASIMSAVDELAVAA